MSNINDWKQANTDIALVQAGSLGVSRAAWVLGARSGRPELINWEDWRWASVSQNPAYATQFDHFTGAAISTRWGTDLSGSATFAVNSQVAGAGRVSVSTVSGDHATVTSGLNWRINNGWTYVVAKVATVTNALVRAIEIGISDATSETAGLAFSNHAVGTVAAVADNALVFGYSTADTMTNYAVDTVNAAGTPTATDTAIAPSVSPLYQFFEIVVGADGDAWFYLNGNLVAQKESAIAATAVVTAWVSLKSTSAAAKSIDIDLLGISGTATN